MPLKQQRHLFPPRSKSNKCHRETCSLDRDGCLTAASCSRSSSLVTVTERSHVYFLFMVSCIFLSFSSASFTSEKNWEKEKKRGAENLPSFSVGDTAVSLNLLLYTELCRSFANKSSEYLEVGSVLFQVGFNAAAQLQNPTPLSLQSCSEGLRSKSRVQSSRGSH